MIFDKATIEFLMASVAFFGGLLYVIAQWYNGRGQRKLDDVTEATRTIQLLKDRADALDVRVTELEDSLIEEQKKIVALETEKAYFEKLNKQYLEILQNRNPEYESFIQQATVSLQTISKGIEELLKKAATPTVAIHNEKS